MVLCFWLSAHHCAIYNCAWHAALGGVVQEAALLCPILQRANQSYEPYLQPSDQCMCIDMAVRSRYRKALQQARAQRDAAVRQAANLTADLNELRLHLPQLSLGEHHTPLNEAPARWSCTVLTAVLLRL